MNKMLRCCRVSWWTRTIFALGILSWRAPLIPLFSALFIKDWSVTLTNDCYCPRPAASCSRNGKKDSLLHSKWSAQASLIYFHFGIYPTLAGTSAIGWQLCNITRIMVFSFFFFPFFFEGGSSAAILLGWCWTVVNQSWRFPTTPSGVNPKGVCPQIEGINPSKEKRSRSVQQQRVSKQSVGHFGHLE